MDLTPSEDQERSEHPGTGRPSEGIPALADGVERTYDIRGHCHYCGPTDDELRPYGPGGSTVCFPCATSTPEREQAAQGVFGALLDMTSSVGLTAIGSEAGPINVDAEDIDVLLRRPSGE